MYKLQTRRVVVVSDCSEPLGLLSYAAVMKPLYKQEMYTLKINSTRNFNSQKPFPLQFCVVYGTFLCLCPLLLSETVVLALDLEGVHDVKLHHPSSSVATSNQ